MSYSPWDCRVEHDWATKHKHTSRSSFKWSQVKMLCPSRKISQWPPGSRYLMQKQESFYYQAGAGAPTRYRSSGYREEPWALGYIAYIGYSRAKNLKNGSLRVWLVIFWWRVRCWVLIGFHFPGWPRVLIGSHFPGLIRISQAGQGFWLVPRWRGEVRGFPKALFPEPYKME